MILLVSEETVHLAGAKVPGRGAPESRRYTANTPTNIIMYNYEGLVALDLNRLMRLPVRVPY